MKYKSLVIYIVIMVGATLVSVWVGSTDKTFPPDSEIKNAVIDETTEARVAGIAREIEAHLAKYPDDMHRHIGWCGTPSEESASSFSQILEGHPAEVIIPFLAHTAPYLRSAVMRILNEMGESAKPAMEDAYENGNARIKLMLINHVDPEVSDDLIFELMDEIIQDPDQSVFYEDLWFIVQSTEFINYPAPTMEEYPFDIYSYYMRLMTESDYAPDKSIAVGYLASFGDAAAGAIPEIIKLLEGDDEYIESMAGGVSNFRNHSLRQAAAIALGEFGPTASSTIPVLVDAMNETRDDYYSDYVHLASASSLYLIGHERDEMLDYLIDRLESEVPTQMNKELVGDICSHLGRIGSDAVDAIPTLIERTHHDHHWVYNPARRAISDIEGSNDTAIRLLSEQLDEDDIDRRYDAIYGLSGYRNDDLSIAVPGLLDSLDDLHGYYLRTLGELLVTIGGHDQEVVEAITDELENLEEDYNECMYVLTRVGPAASSAIPALQDIIENDDEIVRFGSAVNVYNQIGGSPEWLIPRLIDRCYWDKTTYNADDVAIWALRNLGPVAVDALPDLRLIAAGDDERKAMYAEEAIAAIENDLENGSQ